MSGQLFFIALLPGQPIEKEVLAFKQYAASHFGSSRALRSPAHITLFPPFSWPLERLPELEVCLRQAAAQVSAFELGLKNFNCFPPRVIFVDVAPSEALHALHRHLKQHLKDTLGLEGERRPNFNPHLTVAFKDLKRSVFPEAWAHYTAIQYERRFRADALALLEHRAEGWVVVGRFAFVSQLPLLAL
jgi:2'-5' RNA ligase